MHRFLFPFATRAYASTHILTRTRTHTNLRHTDNRRVVEIGYIIVSECATQVVDACVRVCMCVYAKCLTLILEKKNGIEGERRTCVGWRM